MADVRCPVCDACADWAGDQAYCSACGWNRDKAEAKVRSNTRIFVFWLIVFLASILLILIVATGSARSLALVPLPGAAILAIRVFRLRRAAEAFAAHLTIPRAPAQPHEGAAAPATGSLTSLNEDDRAVMRMACPREIRPTLYTLFVLPMTGLFLIVALGSLFEGLVKAWSPMRSLAAFGMGDLVRSIVGAFLVLILFVLIYSTFREFQLSRNGSIAVAKVWKQSRSGRGGSWISYKYFDAQCAEFSGACRDNTNALFEGMSCLVFYDADKPSRNVAACGSSFKIVIPE
jgi:hypothetical protein